MEARALAQVEVTMVSFLPLVHSRFSYGVPHFSAMQFLADHDDLVFTVTDSSTPQPSTPSPSNKPTLEVSVQYNTNND